MSNETNNRYSIYPLENRDAEWSRTKRTAFDRRPNPRKPMPNRVEEPTIISAERKAPKRDLPFYGMAL